MVIDPQTNTHTHKQTGPITIHCAAKLIAQCNNSNITRYILWACVALVRVGIGYEMALVRVGSRYELVRV